MEPQVYWIATPATGRLATMARPRGGEWLADELGALKRLGADTLVCLLTVLEQIELELEAEGQHAQALGLQWVSFPISDFTVPPLNQATFRAIADVAQQVQAGRSVIVHCRAGIGRSSLFAASVLVVLGLHPAEAFARITTARGRPVPDTAEQRAWVERFAEAQALLAQLD